MSHFGDEPDSPEECAWRAKPGDWIWILHPKLKEIQGNDIKSMNWPSSSDAKSLIEKTHAAFLAGVRVDILAEET